MRFLARLKMKGLMAKFITLTFKGYPSNAQAKSALHAFVQHLRRNFPNASAVWRMEFQKRGSIHFHLLCFDLPWWDWKELLETWKRITHQDVARIDIQLIRSRKGVMHYVSKYIAKVERKSGKSFFIQVPYLHAVRKWRKGRFWGYHNKKLLPVGELVTGVLTDRKQIKRLSNAAWEIIGTSTRYNAISFHLFSDYAISIARMNIEKHGRTLEEWEYTVKDHMTPKHHYDTYTKRFSDAELETKEVLSLGRLSKGERSELVQPLTTDWIKRASFSHSASGVA